jgi:hypothetical protein
MPPEVELDKLIVEPTHTLPGPVISAKVVVE